MRIKIALSGLMLLTLTVMGWAASTRDDSATGAVPAAAIHPQGTASAAEAAPPVPVTADARSAVVGGPSPLTPAESVFYRTMARTAWTYMETHYDPATGFVRGSPEWANTTLWDIGGQLLAFLAARDLGLITPADFDAKVGKTLSTLEKIPLFRGIAYNKIYPTATIGAGSNVRGWSATDLGRFLLALKILAVHEPRFAQQAERVARRNNFKEIVKGGYLFGQLIGSNGKPWTFQEGRIGYEQYVAAGFAAWGADVKPALDVNANARPVTVMGVPLLQDKRYQDRLVSEPFILHGLELGLSGDYGELAANMLRAQEARYRATGAVTIATEDAVSIPPDYFYYYCVYCNGKPFVIDLATPGKERNSPRWVSTKGAYGWHALLPGEYTKIATDYVATAHDAKKGWASGVFEESRASTNSFDVNTAAVLMEVAYFQLRGDVPLMRGRVP
jgi:hypothetical protein